MKLRLLNKMQEATIDGHQVTCGTQKVGVLHELCHVARPREEFLMSLVVIIHGDFLK
jgi:hypothetical protein